MPYHFKTQLRHRNLLGAATLPAITFASALALQGCGGGSTAATDPGGLVARAGAPTCSASIVRGSTPGSLSSQAKTTDPNVFVPASNVERDADVGVKFHTNHFVLKSSASRAHGVVSGFHPSDITGAYGVPAGSGSGAIAIVAAFHSNTALTDFNTFSNQFGLPTETSSDPTSPANTHLQVVYSAGTKPSVDSSWAQEIALDIEWAHAIAPNAKIYLVESPSAGLTDLMNAVNVAKAQIGVRQVSMSFGGTETSCEYASYDNDLVQNGVEFFGAAGDTAGEKDFPSLSANCVCVGGTSLVLNLVGARSTEKVWKATGGGRSAFEPRPVFQDNVIGTITGYRSGNDISAVSDPNTGVAVYAGTADAGLSGWLVFGGTSAATPIVAGIANASGTTRTSSQDLNSVLYGEIGGPSLFDVTTGSVSGASAVPGWDYPSGCGAPTGTGAF